MYWTKHFKIDLYKAVITDKVLFTFSVSLSEKSNIYLNSEDGRV